MTLKFKELEKSIDKNLFNILCISLETFFNQDLFLIENWIHEQSISHKIAHYFENNNNIWLHIDVEYNKQWKNPKEFKTIMSHFEDWVYTVLDNKTEIICVYWRIIKRHNDLVLALIEEWWNIVIWKVDWENRIIVKSKGVRPDIIIHERWNNKNFCIFEIKKKELNDEDKIKLEWFTDDKLNYWYMYWIWLSNFTINWCEIILYEHWKENKKFYFKFKQ